MAFDCSRSSALSWQFPVPIWAQGLSTGSTNSEWRRQWRQLHRWRNEDIARQLSEYWDSVPQNDKDSLITHFAHLSALWSMVGALGPASGEPQVRIYFDLGISAT